MLRVRVELVPGGVGEPELLGELVIANDVRRSFETAGARGDYNFRLRGKRGRLMSTGQIRDWPRRRRNVWDLVAVCLNSARSS